MTNYRMAEAIILTLEGKKYHGYNYYLNKEFEADKTLIELIENLEEISKNLKYAHILKELEDLGILIRCGSEADYAEKEFISQWEWGAISAAFHRSLCDREAVPLEENTRRQKEKIAIVPPPALFGRDIKYRDQIKLRRPDSELIETMKKRRTIRDVETEAIPLETVSEILYSGMAIVGFAHNGVCEVPLAITPSGGARNPFEAYLIARNIDGLVPGIYHYSALDHALGRVNDQVPESLGDIVGGQDWANAMPCMIILGAFLERSMWKYNDPNGYRVVFIEAGHIGQNMMLTATSRGYTACPTGVISAEFMQKYLGERRNTSISVYAIGIGRPRENSKDNEWISI